jgi:hypothetical protein
MGGVTSQAGVEEFPSGSHPPESGGINQELPPPRLWWSCERGLTETVEHCSCWKVTRSWTVIPMAAEYLSTGEAARIPGVSRVAVTLMVQKGRRPAIRVGLGYPQESPAGVRQ